MMYRQVHVVKALTEGGILTQRQTESRVEIFFGFFLFQEKSSQGISFCVRGEQARDRKKGIFFFRD
jgi:hypothetical protein